MSFIAVCTDTILTSEAEIKKQFGSAPNIKTYLASEKSVSISTTKAVKALLEKVKEDEVKRLSSTLYIFYVFSFSKMS